MKIIFLDFDGVIRIPFPTGGPEIDAEFSSERMKRVAQLAAETGAQIVISSDWRHMHDWAGIARLLEPHIPRELMHVDWRTPLLVADSGESNIAFPVPRGAEIVSWLSKYPEVSHFVILDDMPRKKFPTMNEQLVLCQLLDGFTEERYSKAMQVLGGEDE